MKKIIYLVHRFPFPPNKGDKIRSYHILKQLCKKYEIYLGTFVDDAEDNQYITDIENQCKDICIDKPSRYLAPLRSFLTGQSISETMYYSKRMADWLDQIVNTEDIEAIICFSSAMGQYCLKYKDNIKTHIVDYVDMDSEKWRAYGLKRSFPINMIYQREARKLLEMETKIAKSIHASLFVTEDERKLFESITHLREKIYTVHNGVDMDYFDPKQEFYNPYFHGKYNIVFIGRMDYWPNVDAVQWFCKHVFDRILNAVPAAKFYIVGAKPTQAVQLLAKRTGIVVTGQVTDIRPYLKHAQIAVAPLQIGRGVQNKVLEAMAMAIPIVLSEEALRGIQVTQECPIHVAQNPVEWFNTIMHLLREPPTTESRQSLRQNILEQYSWDSTLKPLMALLD